MTEAYKTLAVKPEITAGNMLSDLLHVWMSSSEIDPKRSHESLTD